MVSAVKYLSIVALKFKPGDSVSLVRRISKDDVENFAKVTGDANPVHFGDATRKGIVHGALLNGLVSGIIGTKLPGPGTLVVSQNLNFPSKCYVDDVVTIKVELVEVRKIVKVKFVCDVGKSVVMYGDAKLVFVR